MKEKILGFICFVVTSFGVLYGQGSLLPMGSPEYQTYERLRIKYGGSTEIHTSIKPINRIEISKYLCDVASQEANLSKRDLEEIQFAVDNNNLWTTPLLTTNSGQSSAIDSTYSPKSNKLHISRNKRSILGLFYPTPANLAEVNSKYFNLRLNPFLNVQVGRSRGEEGFTFANQRGLELYGDVDQKVYFYSNLVETQQRFQNYVTQYAKEISAIPGAGNLRNYQSGLLGGISGYDYMNAQGYVGFNISKHVGIQLGHGRNFLGDGYRSLFLSDFSHNYFYLKLNTKVWKFHYQNIFAELTDFSSTSPIFGNQLFAKKYTAMHYLSYNVSQRWNVGLFESVVFNRSRQFEFQYLNPLIFYRTVELFVGSPDNALIGFSTKYDFSKSFSIYGQFLLDEFIFKNVRQQNGNWTNKYGGQLGIKYVNALGVDQLDVQLELNFVRPYTYTHFDSSSNYVHFNQPLAHPLGANFVEMLGILHYKPHRKWSVEWRTFFARKGEDDLSQNWGGNILKDYTMRPRDNGNEIGQGVQTSTLLSTLDVSYQIYHQMYFDFTAQYRHKASADPLKRLNTSFISGGFRVNLARQRFDF